MGRGSPGYRLRLPTEVHPITAGIKGGIAGGIAMTVPALAYGVVSGKSIWYPVNLLAGMVVPGLTPDEAAQFHAGLLVLGVVIHVMMSLIMGLVYGVLLPTLPEIPREISWGGLLAPLLWTAVSFVLMEVVNPTLRQGVNWFWFIVSQFVYGIVMATALMTARKKMRPIPAAVVGGLVGALAMPIPAVLWSLVSGRGPWYPANLLAGMVMPDMRALPLEQLQAFRADWLAAAVGIHLTMSVAFAVALTVLLPRLPPIPGPMAWGALLMPLLWTGVAYGLMGVANPLLQEAVSWPWFVVSQFVFGVAASIIVVRSEKVYIPPAGTGPEDTQMERWVTGEPTKSEEGTPPGQGEGPR